MSCGPCRLDCVFYIFLVFYDFDVVENVCWVVGVGQYAVEQYLFFVCCDIIENEVCVCDDEVYLRLFLFLLELGLVGIRVEIALE